MNSSFDKSLPQTTTYWTEGDVFFVKNTNFLINEEESHALAELLIYAMEDQSTKHIVVDNRLAKGAWPQEVFKVWEKDDRYLKLIKTKKMATLTSSVITMNQTNRVSRKSGLENTSRAFNSDFDDVVYAFLQG